MKSPTEKERKIEKIIEREKSAVVAFSGGVDSSLVSFMAKKVLNDLVVAVTATSPIYPPWDAEDAEKIAERIGIRHIFIETEEFDDQNFITNPPNRCYHCKRGLLQKLDEIRRNLGFQSIFDGTNKDDHSDYRPGMKAVEEFGVVSPLSEAGLTKKETRTLAKRFNLPVADKPASPCLASRIPYGKKITRKKLDRIERAEKFLRELGFEVVRVRDFDDLAKIELDKKNIPRGLELREEITKHLKELGYKHVCLDLEGYRTGSLNP